MKKWFTMFIDTVKVFILFTGCTLLFYYGMIWLNQEYENYHRYDEPNSGAIKVTNMVESNEQSWFERIILFYMNGE